MLYVVFLVMGMACGAVCTFLLVQEKHRSAVEQKRVCEGTERTLQRRLGELQEKEGRLSASLKEVEAQVVSYAQLRDENAILKGDLRNIDIGLRKSQLDVEIQAHKQKELDERADALCGHYVKDSIKWLTKSLTSNNFVAIKQRLLQIIAACRDIGFQIPQEQENAYVTNLKEEFERIVRLAFQREEQARIKAQIREQQKLEREIEREMTQIDRERAAIQAALKKALAEAADKHSDEVERLKTRLAEAEAKAQRAQSMAQMTKAGHVYVISNIGSFGDNVFKIGMTRRLEPEIRVRELGDASVPFPFDVHMMISCEDAPSLENALHRAFHQSRLNRINPRKEFYRSNIDDIRKIVEDHHGSVDYVVDPEALEYRQSMSMSEEDSDFIESVYNDLEEEGEAQAEE